MRNVLWNLSKEKRISSTYSIWFLINSWNACHWSTSVCALQITWGNILLFLSYKFHRMNHCISKSIPLYFLIFNICCSILYVGFKLTSPPSIVLYFTVQIFKIYKINTKCRTVHTLDAPFAYVDNHFTSNFPAHSLTSHII